MDENMLNHEVSEDDEITAHEEHLIKLGKAQKKFKLKYRFRSIGHNLFSDVTFMALMVAAVMTILSCISIVTVRGTGMEPTFPHSSIIVVNKKAYEKRIPVRGDVVVTKDNRIFRVIGLPGDQIDLYAGRIYINDEPVTESYRADDHSTRPIGRNTHFSVYEGTYFLLCDDRECYDDSRNGRMYSLDEIQGRVSFKW